MSEAAITYGRHRQPLDPRNAAIVAQRVAPPTLLPTAHALHPRDVRLAVLRRAAAAPWMDAQTAGEAAAVPAATVKQRLLAYLRQLSAGGDGLLPDNGELAAALGVSHLALVSTALARLQRDLVIKRIVWRQHRAVRLVGGAAVLRSRCCPPGLTP